MWGGVRNARAGVTSAESIPMTESSELGSQKKYEAARKLRVARRAQYQYSGGKPGMGKRFLTEVELNWWYSTLERHMQAKTCPPGLKGKR